VDAGLLHDDVFGAGVGGSPVYLRAFGHCGHWLLLTSGFTITVGTVVLLVLLHIASGALLECLRPGDMFLGITKSREAKCSSEQDQQKIRGYIESHGGFEAIDFALRNALQHELGREDDLSAIKCTFPTMILYSGIKFLYGGFPHTPPILYPVRDRLVSARARIFSFAREMLPTYGTFE